MDNIKQLIGLPENAVIEYKSAKGGLPASLWETYSSFANSNGGIIVLGVKEKNGHLTSDNLTEDQLIAYKKNFWDIVHNRAKVSATLVTENDVTIENWQGSSILVINVPRARFDQRPVYLNHNPFGNTYVRHNEGDYLCSDDEVRLMFADAESQKTSFDSKILKNYTLDDLDLPTIQQYRTRFDSHNTSHPWSKLTDMEFLQKVGAYKIDKDNNEEGFTRAGVLMFGKTESITDNSCAPYFFPDVQVWHVLDRGERWSDRICPDGYWEANLFQFFYRAYAKLIQPLPVPFQLEGVQRVDETSAHKAIREALVNTLVHTNYRVMGSTLIKIEPERIIMRNPGRMLITVEEYYAGSHSVCRNPVLQNMFRFLGFGEKAGSGADIIAQGWADNHWARPVITEYLTRSDYTELVLNLKEMKEALTVNTTETTTKSTTETTTESTTESTTERILEIIKNNPKITNREIAEMLGLTEDGVFYHTKKLRMKGRIRRIDGDFGGHWEILK